MLITFKLQFKQKQIYCVIYYNLRYTFVPSFVFVVFAVAVLQNVAAAVCAENPDRILLSSELTGRQETWQPHERERSHLTRSGRRLQLYG